LSRSDKYPIVQESERVVDAIPEIPLDTR
jgi:hypothetical protein